KAALTTGKIPLIPRNSPPKANSPTNSVLRNRSLLTCSEAAKTPIAIGKSYRPPPFGMSAGDKLMVMRCGGNSKPLFIIAARTRSLDSLTAVSGIPTIDKLGNPGEICTSTRTCGAVTPNSARDKTTANFFIDTIHRTKVTAYRKTMKKSVVIIDSLCKKLSIGVWVFIMQSHTPRFYPDNQSRWFGLRHHNQKTFPYKGFCGLSF